MLSYLFSETILPATGAFGNSGPEATLSWYGLSLAIGLASMALIPASVIKLAFSFSGASTKTVLPVTLSH